MRTLAPYRLALLVSLVFILATSADAQTSSASSTISPLSADIKAAMTGKSWNPGCPVPLDDLVAVSVRYFGFDSQTHNGTLVMNKRFAAETSKIFDELYKIHFPINQVSPYENYGPDIYAEQNITVGFYCRKAQDSPGEWSGHAYGAAIDINPRDNPFLDAKQGWWPKVATSSAPRDGAKGKIYPNTEIFRIFTRHGWAWGGFYVGEPDYMHFYKLTVGGSGSPLERPYVATGLQYLPGGAMEAAQPK